MNSLKTDNLTGDGRTERRIFHLKPNFRESGLQQTNNNRVALLLKIYESMSPIPEKLGVNLLNSVNGYPNTNIREEMIGLWMKN